jgi:hypothetical protein
MLLAVCALAAPASASAMEPTPTGGAGVPVPTGGASAPDSLPALTATPHVLVGGVALFRGSFPAREAGRTVAIERFDAKAKSWTAIAGARVDGDGSYVARWRADVTGRHLARARLERAGDAGASQLEPAYESTLTVYRPAVASWYGPGFFGRTTACGLRMTRTLLGVAHRRLPCGAEVALSYRGRSITVPVVDRGPFHRNRRWDLTAATAAALGFTFTDRIGAVRVG